MKMIPIYSCTVILSLATMSGANAQSCTNNYRCGEAFNRTQLPMQYTDDLNAKEANTLCEVWNWNYGFGGRRDRYKEVMCSKQNLIPGQSVGFSATDVDAFTFPNSNYLLDFHGTLSWRKSGMWTKIHNYEGVNCVPNLDFHLPICTIYWN
ncbi:MAG: hypothetical protein ACU836_09665 [Gammaproteobacteria bacterium]